MLTVISRGHAHVVYYNNKGDHQFSDVDEICPESNSQENKTFNPKVRQGFQWLFFSTINLIKTATNNFGNKSFMQPMRRLSMHS
jgi:hypothetical protein